MREAVTRLYEPINRYKPLAANIGVVDGPLEFLTMLGVKLPLPFTTRMTVIRLRSGDLFCHSPVAFDAALAEELGSMGRIRHLVSPNQFHYAHIGDWARAFPNAVTWASPHVRERARSRGIDVHFARDLAPSAPEEWRDELDQTFVPGGIFGEYVFFHRATTTLVVADTIMNLELDKLRPPWRLAARLSGMYYPRGEIFFGMRLPLMLQRRRAKAAFDAILSWGPKRIVLSHGRIFETDGDQVLRRMFRRPRLSNPREGPLA